MLCLNHTEGTEVVSVASDEVAWIFVGVLIGIPTGVLLGWCLAQIVLPRPSTVVIKKIDNDYIIRES